MDEFIRAVVQGVPIGGVFALVAVGFVLTYKTSGVFNLAFGGQAFASAALYFKLHVIEQWPQWISLVLSVFVLAPLIGLALERVIFRHLRGASDLARLVVSIGMLVLIPAVMKEALNIETVAKHPVGIFPEGLYVYRLFGRYPVSRDEISQVVFVVIAALVLAALFRFTALGLQMRAVVESSRMTELAGIRSDRVTAFSWALSSTFAGLAGVLIAPRYATVNESYFFVLVVAGIAAAAIGGLTNLPRSLAGGFALGIAAILLRTYLPQDSIIARQIQPALPFVVLFGVVLLWKDRATVSDPLATVDPPLPTSAGDDRGPLLLWGTRGFWTVILGLMAMHALVWGNEFRTTLYTQAVIYAVIFLSVTVFTGIAGEISLCQSSFAAIGAFATMQLAERFGVSVIGGALIGAAIAALVGAILALPLMRLGGIWLALATLAFALLFESVIVNFDWVGGAVPLPKVPRPLIGAIDFERERTFFVLCVVVLLLVAFVVVRVRNGTTGMFLAAMRGSETAIASIGVSRARLRVTAFALSAAIAGLGGGLLAMYSSTITYTSDFGPFVGLFWVVLVVNLSTRTIEGAMQAAAGFILFPEYILKPLHLGGAYQYIFFGIGAITFARHPEGILEFQKRRSMNAVQRRLDRRAGGGDSTVSPPADASKFGSAS